MTGAVAQRFNTEQIADRERVEGWRHIFGRSVCELDIEPSGAGEFRSSAVLRVLPDLGVICGESSGARYWHPRRLIRNDDVIVVINHLGTDRAEMLGQERIVRAGEAVLLSAEEVGGVANGGPSRFTTLRVPKAAFGPASPDLSGAVLRPVAANDRALSLLKSYLGVLKDDRSLAEPGAATTIAANIRDLIAITFDARGNAEEVGERRGLRAARLRALKSDILLHAGESDFNIAALARRHGVTPRYVQKLLDESGATFSELLARARLANAYRMLRDDRYRRTQVADIAAAVGFGNTSYFNRAFRKRFGAAPREVRKATGAARVLTRATLVSGEAVP